MKLIRPAEFRSDRAWGALDVSAIDDATVRLHWTDAPYDWHVNDGEEVFVVLQGTVEMRARVKGEAERVFTLAAGDILHVEAGDEHSARPVGEARVLVIERRGSA